MGYDGSLKFDTKIDESGFSAGINKLGGIAKGGLAVLGGLIAGFGAVTKSALDSVASLEQNIGGVQTLFKESADAVITNAERAYETAGMSANTYMSTVTSFSASLLQSLGGDTVKAAQYADRAIIDMADNANKMGSSMESIQNAYQGFAKQNYTMLDNLKLGYGGTKTEMQRLIKDAAKMKDVQKELGITVDASSMSFGNIVNAISVMQKSMGIAGTTAEEAATTIEGSMNSAKAAWDNFLNGSVSVDDFVDSVVTAGTVIAENLGQIVPRLLATIPGVIKGLGANLVSYILESAPAMSSAGMELVTSLSDSLEENIPVVTEQGIEIIESLASNLTENVPVITEQGAEIISGLASGLIESIPAVAELGIEIITSLVSSLTDNIPVLMQTGMELLSVLVNGILNSLPSMISSAGECINSFISGILLALPSIINSGSTLLDSLINGITTNLPFVVQSAMTVINEFVNSIVINLPSILSAGVELLLSFVDGIIDSLPTLVSSALEAVTSFIETVVSNLPQILETGITLLGELAAGLIQAIPDLVGKVPEIVSSVIDAFMETDWDSVGSDIVSGIANGLSGAVGTIVDAAKGVAKSALDSAKEFLGIKSPSRVFRDQVGKMMAEGMGIGFEKNIPIVDIETGLDEMMERAGKKVSSINSIVPETTKAAISKVTNNYTGNPINYKKIKQAQKEALNEANERPIYLNNRQINRAYRDGGVVLV